MTKLSKIFSLASVSQLSDSKWSLVPDSSVKFSKSDLKLIESCTVYTCNGANGTYKAVKINVPKLNNSYWFTLDVKSSKLWEHQDVIEPEKLVVYQLQSADDDKVITRCRIIE